MQQFKFQPGKTLNYAKTTDIYRTGFFTELYDDLCNNIKVTKLTVDQFCSLPAIYGCLNYKSGEHKIMELENDTAYKTSNGHEIRGRDLKAITLIMYVYSRGMYVEYKAGKHTTQIQSPDASAAIPVGLLGFKRFRDIPYSSWVTALGSEPTIEQIFNLDLLMGKAFASTSIKGDDVHLNMDLGLISMLPYANLDFSNPELITYFRTLGMGNYKGHYSTAYGSVRCTKDGDFYPDEIQLYNKSNSTMRLLLAQRWAWFGNHRNSDMICSYQNWDVMPADVEAGVSMVHTKPGTKWLL